jgi:hypothetical protein
MTTLELDALPPLTDGDLTAQALAADPDLVPDATAEPFDDGDAGPTGLLPSWYMPVPVTGSCKRWHRVLAIAAIAGFLVINAFGFCITYGLLERA